MPVGISKPLGEDRCLVGYADPPGIFEDNDFVVLLLAGFDLRVGLAGSDPQAAGGVEVHLNRLGQQRVGGEQIDLEALGHFEGLRSNSGSGSGMRASCWTNETGVRG